MGEPAPARQQVPSAQADDQHANEATAPDRRDGTLSLPEDEDDSPENRALDVEADEMMLEYARTQAEVAQMLEEQRSMKDELGGLKDGLAAELLALQDETFRLTMHKELEMFKLQLAKIATLESNLDDAEKALDDADAADDAAADEEAGPDADPVAAILARVNRRAASAVTAAAQRDASARTDQDEEEGGEEDDGEALDYDLEAAEITKLQENLDQELAQMYAQLQSVKQQAAGVAVRKAQLEAELQSLIALQEQDQAERDSEEQTLAQN